MGGKCGGVILQYAIVSAVIHWIKRQESDMVAQRLCNLGTSTDQLFNLCETKHFPDLCIMLANYLDECNIEVYSRLINFAF